MVEPTRKNAGVSPALDHESAAAAVHDLARLRQQAQQARIRLNQLKRELVEAESHLGSHQAVQLLEANEQLVLSSLRAHTDAETAAQALKEASRSAELDALTQLPNRVLMLDRLASAIAHAKRRRTRLALLFLDLNRFKQINDTLGHAFGDEVLKLVALRMAAAVREADTVSRHGGDEFLILLNEVSQPLDAAAIADKLVTALAAPSRVGDHVLRLSASVGISIYPDDGEDAQTLIERADAAMYQAKRKGLQSFTFQHADGVASLPSLQPPLTALERAAAGHANLFAELQEANEQLVLAALSAKDLQAAAEQAQQRQTELLAVVAHELRNPLTPIRTAAALLGHSRADEALLLRVKAIIERQVSHMARLVGDLLDVSRAHTGKLRLERRRVDMRELIDRAVQACRPAMDARLQHFSVFVPACALVVDGDPLRLEQVLCNLLDNATKYTQVGGQIGLTVVTGDATMAITVADNGIGISAAALPKVFDAFVQDKHAVGFNGVGLGIGLTVVRELVEAHGGSVVASSAGSGFGSQLVITLPLLDE